MPYGADSAGSFRKGREECGAGGDERDRFPLINPGCRSRKRNTAFLFHDNCGAVKAASSGIAVSEETPLIYRVGSSVCGIKGGMGFPDYGFEEIHGARNIEVSEAVGLLEELPA